MAAGRGRAGSPYLVGYSQGNPVPVAQPGQNPNSAAEGGQTVVPPLGRNLARVVESPVGAAGVGRDCS